MIIDTSYFSLPPLQIPNAEDNIPNNSGRNYSSNTGLQAFIDRYEVNLLFGFLGADQLAELNDQFKSDGEWKDDALQKWKDLVDGVDNWFGLRKTYGVYKVSLIAYYVFYHYLRDTESFYATTGIVKPDVANAITLSANVDLVTQWNEFVEMYQGNDCGKKKLSLYSFMNSRPDDYDTSFFTLYGFKNRHGL